MKIYKVVTDNRESYLAGFLCNEYSVSLDLLEFLIVNGFILKYNKGDIVEALPDTIGIVGFLDYRHAESYRRDNLPSGCIIKLKALTPVMTIQDYAQEYGYGRIASMSVESFRKLINKEKMFDGSGIVRSQRHSCCVTQKVEVLT